MKNKQKKCFQYSENYLPREPPTHVNFHTVSGGLGMMRLRIFFLW